MYINTPKNHLTGGGYDNFHFGLSALASLKNFKNFNLLKLSLFTIFSLSSLEAAIQADYDKSSNAYIITKHKFNNNDVYDYTNNTYKFLNGKNFYGQMASNKNLSHITLIYDNPKDNTSALHFRQDILTPSIKEDIFVINGFHGAYSSNTTMNQISYIPFLVSAYAFNAKANNNTLVLKAGELSSVYYLKPTNKEVINPKASGLDNKYNFLITPAIARKGEASNNTLNFLKDAYVNMGVENTYTLALNGAPYIVGAFGIDANTNNNTVILNDGVKIDFHTTPYQQSALNDGDIFDERMTHVVGAIAYNANANNNKLLINGASLIVHGPSGSYSTSAATHMAGGFVDVNNNQSYEVRGNSVIINDLQLDLRVDAKNTPLAYNAVLVGEIFGGRIMKGNAYKNTIDIKDLQTLLELNNNIEVKALLDFYAGVTNNGIANDNSVRIHLKKPFEINSNFTGKNEFNIYGGVATKGASGNSIHIDGDLTQGLTVEDNQDKIQIIAAQTLSSKANNNSIVINNSNIAMPLFLYAVSKANLDNKDYYASSAYANSIVLDNVKSGRNLTAIIEADNLEKNTINYNLVQSLTNASNIDKGSKVILRANQKANDNTLNIKDYSSKARDNVYIIKAKDESTNNNIIFDNITLGTASNKREGEIVISAGIAKNTHDNYTHIHNLNIDEYKDNFSIVIAASGVYGKNDKSYNNTLYLSGDINIFNHTDAKVLVTGSFLRIQEDNNFKSQALTHQSGTNNHLVLNTNITTNTINNFDHYSFILKDNIQAYLSAKEAIYLSKDSSINVYTNNEIKNKSFVLMQSEKGFVNANNKRLNQQDLQQLLNTISKNNYKLHQNIKAKTQKANCTLSVSKDAKSIYVNLN
ncbi:hypothetical protein CSUB8523_1841 [Campylobacter subantarcticus LMG 24377]|nr:hypothetical protein [Campylobacter subantarcticus]AJC92270.1 hypothetical protein CSUB8523_0747 [Campylobacter subantarcticus LMG 24377]AJC92943.1 hypothetical protein CSUB8523_1440 [Campylobacter subantarcticus LMG 24377]AJC93313.1 hypothetical protein CSUB8523_1841 [Campylobacter subantarcticus LMG 24377]